MSLIIVISTVFFSFLCGAIPTGYLLVKKYCGIDIRTKGSGNIGSTNVKRVAGSKISVLTQGFDIVKGLVPVAFAIYIASIIKLPIEKNTFFSIVAIAAVIGHNYTPFLGFNGGKGVNTTMGAFILIAPIPTILGIVMHFFLRIFTPIVSIRSVALGLTIPVVCIIMNLNKSIVLSAVAAAIIMIIRHKDNLIRLIQGKE